MGKPKRKRMIQIIAVTTLVISLSLWAAYTYINKIGVGSNTGSLPAGYELVVANGYQFSTKISGNKEDVPVILLHGFPESSIMWKRFSADLNKIGYYTVAPDQRGYSFKARPEAIEQYQITHLASDIIAIADALDLDRFHLIGHDWGSGVGWQIAADYPERLRSYTSLSLPHLDAFSRAYREDSLQYKASDYMRKFQTRKLPEYKLAQDDYILLKSIWSKQSEEEITSYVNLFSQKNALTSSLNWYRANYDKFNQGFDLGTIKVPVLFLWGKKDSALKRSGVAWTEEYISGYYRFVELNAGHALMQEAYDDVKIEIVSHLAKFQ